MKVKREIDHIKLKNLKDTSINVSALKGLRRINNVIRKSLLFGISISVFGFLATAYYRNVIYAITEGKKIFLEKLNTMPNKEKLFLDGHSKLVEEYLNYNVSLIILN